VEAILTWHKTLPWEVQNERTNGSWWITNSQDGAVAKKPRFPATSDVQTEQSQGGKKLYHI